MILLKDFVQSVGRRRNIAPPPPLYPVLQHYAIVGKREKKGAFDGVRPVVSVSSGRPPTAVTPSRHPAELGVLAWGGGDEFEWLSSLPVINVFLHDVVAVSNHACCLHIALAHVGRRQRSMNAQAYAPAEQRESRIELRSSRGGMRRLQTAVFLSFHLRLVSLEKRRILSYHPLERRGEELGGGHFSPVRDRVMSIYKIRLHLLVIEEEPPRIVSCWARREAQAMPKGLYESEYICHRGMVDKDYMYKRRLLR
ncbi:hypothetical protein L249_3093, partial [Ophiocordyceps polyrhachis-furcata BCC 54312]